MVQMILVFLMLCFLPCALNERNLSGLRGTVINERIRYNKLRKFRNRRIENSLFYPNDCLTREQAATIIDRYAEAKNSRILEMNRYELNESVCATLSTSEVEYIEELF